jgi:glycosyltransferase involved in cell wall biosynthesis
VAEPKHVLYFAENALSRIQGGGIVASAVLEGLPPERLLGFYDYRNITPAPEYASRFTYLGQWRTPKALHLLNRLTRLRTSTVLHRLFTDRYIRKDFTFVLERIAKTGFTPELVYFSGLSYRFLRLAVMAAEHFDVPMLVLHMDDWMAVERDAAGPRWGNLWYRRIVTQMTRAAERALVSTSNSPRLAARLTALTGRRHLAANNCCADLPATPGAAPRFEPNPVPIITYAGAMNQHLQGETLKILASAVAELNAEGTRVELHIYTPWEFAPAANSIAMPNAVVYRGQVGRDELADAYRRSDFLVTTVTHREANIALFRHSLSTKLSEYLCAGKPVISMGHVDWHLHEYVQDHGCGFSILMDEHYSRSAIKAHLRRILATPPDVRRRIGRTNRALWERAHDVAAMAIDTRRAVGLDVVDQPPLAERRGVVFVGSPTRTGEPWVPARKAKRICRELADVFEHNTVDILGEVQRYPEIAEVADYCRAIGLRPTRVDGDLDGGGRWDPAGARWSLDDAQRHPTRATTRPETVFEQVAALRRVARGLAHVDGPEPALDAVAADSPTARAINQLTVRVSEHGKPARLWLYGSMQVGLEIAAAIRSHAWLSRAVTIAGFISSPGHCTAEIFQGYRWLPIDRLDPSEADLIIVTSATSRYPIHEELTCRDLLSRVVSIFGLAAAAECNGYERVPGGPGQDFRWRATAFDYATSELVARTANVAREAVTPEGETRVAGWSRAA